MSVTVKGAGQKPQSKESELNTAGVSPTAGFFFTSPFRSLSTQGCFAKITLPAAGGDQVNGEFQREVRRFRRSETGRREEPGTLWRHSF